MSEIDNEYYQQIKQQMASQGAASVNDNGQGIIGDVVDTFQHGAYKGVAGISETLGLDSVKEWALEGAQDNRDSLSVDSRNALQKEFVSTGANGELELGDGFTDWRTWVLTTADMIGMNADLLIGGGAVNKGFTALTKIAKFARGKALKQGAPAAIAEKLAQEATRNYAKKHNKLTGLAGDVATYGAVAHAQYGGMQAIDMREEVESMDWDDLKNVSAWRERVNQLHSENPTNDAMALEQIFTQARTDTANAAANATLMNPALITSNVLLGGLGGKMLESLLRGGGKTLAKIGGETATEGFQGATEQYAANKVGQEYVDENIADDRDILKSGLNEAIAGGGNAVAFAGAGKLKDKVLEKSTQPRVVRQPDSVEPTNEQPTNEQPVDEAVNVVSEPEKAVDLPNHRFRPEEDIDKESGEVKQKLSPYILTKDGNRFSSNIAAKTAANKLGVADKYDVMGDGESAYLKLKPEFNNDDIAQSVGNDSAYIRDGVAGQAQKNGALAVDSIIKAEAEQEKVAAENKKLEKVSKLKARAEDVKARHVGEGEYFHPSNYEKLVEAIEDGAETAEIQQLYDSAFVDPNVAFMKREHAKKVAARKKEAEINSNRERAQLGNQRVEESFTLSPPELEERIDTDAYFSDAETKSHEAALSAAEELEAKDTKRRNDEDAFYEKRDAESAVSPEQKERDFDGALSQKKVSETIEDIAARYPGQNKKDQEGNVNKENDESLAGYAVKASGKKLSLVNLRKKLKIKPKKLAKVMSKANIPQSIRDKIFAGLHARKDTELAKLEALSDFSAQADYEPNNLMAEALMDFKPVQKALAGLDEATQDEIKASVVKAVSDTLQDVDDEQAAAAVDTGANEAATSSTNDLPEPSQAQKAANNYKIGRVEHSGFKLGIENPKGSKRSGEDKDGNKWSNTIHHHYGDITGTKGADGDALDVFVNPGTATSDNVYVVDQVDPQTKAFDEHKIMLGFDSKDNAENAYLANYAKGWQGAGNISEVSLDDFTTWTKEADTTKPFAGKVDSQERNTGNSRSTTTPAIEQGLQADNLNEKATGDEPSGFTVERELGTTGVKSTATIKNSSGVVVANITADKADYLDGFNRQIDEKLNELTVNGEKQSTENVDKFKEESTNSSLEMADYKKSVLVTGNTQEHKKALKNAKGLWNKSLGGWIFPKARKAEVEALLLKLNNKGDHDVSSNTGKLDARGKPETVQDAESGGSDRSSTGRVSGTNSGKKPSSSTASEKGVKKPAGNRASNDTSKAGNNGINDGSDSGRVEQFVNNNYRLTDDLNIASSPLQRAADNVDAIDLAKTLLREQRKPTSSEQTTLAKYVGWGNSAIANKLFPTKGERSDKWQAVYDDLVAKVTPDELDTITRSTQYAHYTPVPVIDSMYEALAQFGVKRGSVIEGGMGTGHFVGRHPEKMQLLHTGIEMDQVSALIAKALYPSAGVLHADFVKTALPANHYDMAVGNPPFANLVIKNDKRYGKHGFMLHDYFMAKQIDAVKPGGFAVFVTTSGSMDKQDRKWRDYMEQRADLLGAIRLPNTAFKAEAGTEVVTDILFFQKHEIGRDITDNGQSFQDLTELSQVNGYINGYFARNPEMVLGTLANDTNQFGETLTVKSDGRDIGEALKAAIAKLPKNIAMEQASIEQMMHDARLAELSPAAREYEIYLDDNGDIRQIQDGVGVKMQLRRLDKRGLTKTQEAIVRDYVGVKDATLALYKAQFVGKDWQKEQKKLHAVYDAFVAKHGAVNQEKIINRTDGKTYSQYPVLAAFDLDPEAFRVAALEVEDSETGKWVKGPAFYERVFGGEAESKIESAMDALMVSLNERGHVDIDYIKELYPDVDEAALIGELGGAVFREPVAGGWVTEDEYLSGNVKLKLEQAKKALGDDRLLRRNVEALEAVQPDDIEITLIPANIGAHWIPKEIVHNFAKEVLDFTGSINSVVQGSHSAWMVSGRAAEGSFNTARRDAANLLNAALNRKQVRVTDTVFENGKEKQVLNSSETAAANQKVSEIRDAFKNWIKENSDAANAVFEIYNRDFNTTVPRKYNGVHLTLPRLASRYKLRDWQLNVVWRILQNGNTYMAHGVGAGKTLASTVAGFELKRLGLANKPTYVVLKSTLKQFAAEMLDAYPDAKILVADEKKLDKKNRRRFMAQLTTENWDAVVMTHEAFERIPLSPEFMERRIKDEIASFTAVMDNLDDDDKVSVKALERQIENLENKLEAAQSGTDKDEGFSFEETGIDFLFVDEAHIKHKKIPFPTEQSLVKGVDSQGSAIALDLFLKTRYLQEIKPNKNLVLMSGTPVTNTLGELFNIQRYLQEDVLEQNNISSFDGWSSTFAMTQTDLEMGADGTFKPVTRLNRFTGLPGLMRDFLQVADIITADDIKNNTGLKLPDIKGGQPEIVGVDMTDEMRDYLQELSARLSAIEERKGPPSKGDDIVPVVILDGEMAAIDLRVVGRNQVGPSKLTVMIDRVFENWKNDSAKAYFSKGKQEPKTGSTQMIFSDIRNPAKSLFDIYDFIKSELVKKGVPEQEIAFIQSANNDNKKRRLFKDMNQGRVRILIGGTKNLGTGVNAQQRIAAIHHLTTPYMPSELIQRDGRGKRAGNKNDEIAIDRYATKGTVDAFKWQLLESKDRMINQVMGGDFDVHEVEDLGDSSSQLAMAKAIASGNPLLLESAGLEADVKKLQGMRDAHLNKNRKNKWILNDVESRVLPALESTLAHVEQAAKTPIKSTSGGLFNAAIGSKKFKSRKDFGEYLFALITKVNQPEKIAEVGGRSVYAGGFGHGQVQVLLHQDYESHDTARALAKPVRLVVDLRDVKSGLLDATGFVRQIENQARLVDDLPEMINEAIDAVNKKNSNLAKSLATEFQFNEELKEKQTRLDKVLTALEAGDTSLDDVVVASLPSGQSPTVTSGGKVTAAEAASVIKRLVKGWANRSDIRVIPRWESLPLADREKLGDGFKEAKGFLAGGMAYINVEHHSSPAEIEETVIHEVLRHHGFREAFGSNILSKFNAIYLSLGEAKLKRLFAKYDIDYNAYSKLYKGKRKRNAMMIDELLAHMVRTGADPEALPKNFWQKVSALVDSLREWLRSKGFTFLPEYTEQSLFKVISQAHKVVVNGHGPKPPNGGLNEPVASLKSSASDALTSLGKQSPGTTLKALHKYLGNKLSDTRKHWLGALPRRYLSDIAGKLIPSINTYMALAAQLDADRTDLLSQSAEVVDAWRDANAANPEKAQVLADLMHDATKAGVDPSAAYEVLRDLAGFDQHKKRNANNEQFGETLTADYVKQKIKAINEQMRGRSGENTAKFMQQITELKERWAFEQNRKEAYPELAARFAKLPDDMKAMFSKVNEHYKVHRKEELKALLNRIEDLKVNEKQKAVLRDQMRIQFESNQVEFYFPLQRFGEYFVRITDGKPDADGNEETLVFEMFESEFAQQKFIAEQEALFDASQIKSGKNFQDMKALDQVSGSFVTDIVAELEPLGSIGHEIADTVYQMYLKRLPAMSMRKRKIHRTGVAGYHDDAMRGFAHNMFHSAYQISKLRHSEAMQMSLEAMRTETEDLDGKERNKATDLVDEMYKRHDWVMNPKGGALANKLTSIGFAWYLGVTPAAAVTNLTQTPMLALPVIGSRYGFAKTSKALLHYSGLFVRGGHVDKHLSGDELEAFEQFKKSGLIDKTQTHDLAGVAEGGLEYDSKWYKVMKGVGYLFHHAERYNREVTAMSAYKVAKDSGVEHEAAIKIATDLTFEAHFDYSNSNKARFMQNDLAKVALLFRQHSVNMTYRLWRDFHQMFKGESKEIRAQAKKQFSGIIGMTAIFAGAMGMPLFSLTGNLLEILFDDEDEPWNFDTEFRNFLADHLGAGGGKIAAHGLVDYLTGATVSSRVGMNNLWLRESNREMEGRDAVQHYAEQVLGPVFGLALSAGTGMDLMQKGQVERGIEAMLPKAIKDALKSMRYASDGVQTLSGNNIIDDVNDSDVIKQLLGFSPSVVSEQYERNNAIKGPEIRLKRRRSLLINRWAFAMRIKDRDLITEAMKEINSFNRVNPAIAILDKHRLASMKRRKSNSERSVNGVLIDKRLAGLNDLVRF